MLLNPLILWSLITCEQTNTKSIIDFAKSISLLVRLPPVNVRLLTPAFYEASWCWIIPVAAELTESPNSTPHSFCTSKWWRNQTQFIEKYNSPLYAKSVWRNIENKKRRIEYFKSIDCLTFNSFYLWKLISTESDYNFPDVIPQDLVQHPTLTAMLFLTSISEVKFVSSGILVFKNAVINLV